ncbi:MAG: hypothetical protein AABM43_12110 [Actinomycetota bacterium]
MPVEVVEETIGDPPPDANIKDAYELLADLDDLIERTLFQIRRRGGTPRAP